MKIVTIFWILLAVLCGGYGILIRAIGSGTGFFLVWIALAVIFVGCSAAAQAGLWGIMPQFLRRVTLVLLCLILVLFTGIGGCIESKMNTEGKPGLDYIIVLGAQIYERGPSAVLRFRLDKAVEYLNENPQTKCIVSGGKGSNEPCSESLTATPTVFNGKGCKRNEKISDPAGDPGRTDFERGEVDDDG